ncbi:transposase [uncultured Mucilaginibacter sp.]|uniref:transposase n=1 Tax=uncultured Mucilaginibacter sp. TaxID=797541 RepID=UPI00260E3B3B|nr:transposase [uncultured Mucilaginibacter sp.]
MIKVILDDGTVEVLATNLFNNTDYPHDVFKELYFARWGIETKYDTIKNQLQLEAFSGQKVITIMQDFFITFFLSNLQEIIAKPCQSQLIRINRDRKGNYKINRNIAFGMMKNRIVEIFMIYNPEKILESLEALFIQHIEPIRPNRKYAHKRITVKARSKYQALTNYKRAI